ncbi:PREDICTED: TPR repeat-containing thioredoxin TTL1-like [Nelumbo nucifera]|uniref:Thioredoxin domain-containing protein n=2 Tax=Nelumbo nucifera TaxID=4432 RepID=A0A822XK35_NELNU|nr:PREDICTED: TPR repeat-containing thioredoxin TTL1-like [Nelumbo nucifera]DAD21924.1 TPA_asm: hypothetical protein HUJ06_023387 [Nelumbo nucifera]
MTEMAEYSPEKKPGCGVMVLYSGVFRRRSFWSRRSACACDLPPPSDKNGSTCSKRRRGDSDESTFLGSSNNLAEPPSKLPDKPVVESVPSSHHQNQVRKPSDGIITTNAPSNMASIQTSATTATITKVSPTQGVGQGRKVPKEAISISGELDSMITDHQKTKGSSGLVRASSSNVMLFGHLGNLRQSGSGNSNSNNLPDSTMDVLDYLPKTARETSSKHVNGGNVGMGNIVRAEAHHPKEQAEPLCRTLSKGLDPEELKLQGNEEFKKGRFVEALALYDRAIALDPEKASYRSNKSAALTGMGRLIEAALECREAIRIDPSYHRAHHRLATLYLRLGEAEKALNHYKQSGPEANSNEIAQAEVLQTHLNKLAEARKLKDWQMLLKETECTISSGADSAPQVFALQAEALLRLCRHQDADATLSKGPEFEMEACTKFFGPSVTAQLLLIRAQVDMSVGRFDDAVAESQRAIRLDSSNNEVSAVVKKARAVAAARSRGNNLFKDSKFLEASMAYSEGLEYDPFNSVLLCNRAACRSKLGQFEKAVDDCTKALNVRPSYSKAILRRADCNAKLERWEASIQDYETLIRETPGDEAVGRALFEAQVQLMKQRGEDVKDMKFGEDVVIVSNNERFRHFVTSPGMSVVLFCNKSSDKPAFEFMQQLCKRYPSVNFLKVEVEDHPYLKKSEGVSAVPSFKIYKNGSRVKDIPGNNLELLENCIKFYSA